MLFPVLSFDSSRVMMKEYGKRKVVEKITSVREYNQMISAMKHLTINPITLTDFHLSVNVVPIVNWSSSSGILVTEFCEGLNGEVVLRGNGSSSLGRWLAIFRGFILAMKTAGFLWGDFAPRNMIFNFESGNLWLVDFERNLRLLPRPVTPEVFSRYIRDYAWEEFSSFLFSKQQEALFSGVIKEIGGIQAIEKEAIVSTRKKSLLAILYGNRESYSVAELDYVESLMVQIATPFRVDGQVCYPMDVLDRIATKKGAESYAETAIKLSSFESNHECFFYLRSLERTI